MADFSLIQHSNDFQEGVQLIHKYLILENERGPLRPFKGSVRKDFPLAKNILRCSELTSPASRSVANYALL